MSTATKTSNDFTNNSMELSTKASRSKVSSKSTSELYKADNSKTTSKHETSKSEEFKDVLSSKTNSKDENIQKVDDTNKTTTETKDTTKIDELKGKLEELEDDSKSTSKDDVNDILTQLLNLLNKLGVKEEDLKLNGEINSETLKTMIDGISGDEASKSNSSSIMDKLVALLKNDSVKGNLDTDSLKSMEKLLNNLSANLADDNTEGTKDIKSGIKNLMSQISNILDNKQNQNGKVLTLEDMLNKNYSQDNKESSTENQSNKNATSEATKDNKEVSKEDKFLKSLINDDKDSTSNKINLFASRNQTVQNQGVDAVKELTINKATFADDLIKDVKFMSNNSLKELTVKINPGNLGEITIKLIQEDGVMKANLKANSKETTALLSQNLVDIKKQLGEQNIKIADVNIELYQDDTTFFNQQGFGSQLSEEQGRSNNSNSKNNATITEEDLIDNIETSNNNNIEFFA
ncbi:flagellar hook-length control protein [Clostridium gelidum]|uniref:Flagellar hook-length control protein n=1 Tax=Clostridium gelidum TaxID=704125 RepID=A0ABN6J2L7_9CLOT|nr:flagellar hook-length control protein FliK [Clostridium gelidum]BCZ48591.1 flagellar hook-length control protein [Clostridium gelidum]